MAKKSQSTKKADKKQSAAAAGLLDSPFASSVKDSAQQIWLAGLGAFSKAQAEGGKVFEALVKDGVDLQRKTQSAAEEKLSEVGSRFSGVAGEVSAKAGQQWDRLESIFEDRTARALGKLGIPTARDMEALSRRVDVLSAEVARLAKASSPATPVARKAATPKGTAAKPATKSAAAKAPAKKRPAAAKRAG